VLTAFIGIVTVMWYSTGGVVTEEEMEEEVRQRIEQKERKGKWFSLFKRT
jgi:iron transport multicopper oxidase